MLNYNLPNLLCINSLIENKLIIDFSNLNTQCPNKKKNKEDNKLFKNRKKKLFPQ